MKKYIIPFLVGILLLVGCSSNEPSENAQKAIDSITERYKDEYKGDINENFSFKIYEDSKTNYILAEAYVPDNENPNSYLGHYFYDIDNNDLTYYAADSDYDKKMDSGDYSIIYTSGKFAE
ncbi:hypothetical protein [Enterococcus sp. LJL90]